MGNEDKKILEEVIGKINVAKFAIRPEDKVRLLTEATAAIEGIIGRTAEPKEEAEKPKKTRTKKTAPKDPAAK